MKVRGTLNTVKLSKVNYIENCSLKPDTIRSIGRHKLRCENNNKEVYDGMD